MCNIKKSFLFSVLSTFHCFAEKWEQKCNDSTQTVVYLLFVSTLPMRTCSNVRKRATGQTKHCEKLEQNGKGPQKPLVSVSPRAHYSVQMNISWKAFLWERQMPCCDGDPQTCQRDPMLVLMRFRSLYQKMSRLRSEKDLWFLNNYWELYDVMRQSGAERAWKWDVCLVFSVSVEMNAVW